MKIIQIIDSLDIGGAENMCIQLSNLMHRKGHEVTILYFRETYNSFFNKVEKGIDIKFIQKELHHLNFYIKIASVLRRFDVVHIHMKSSLKVIYLSSFLTFKKLKYIFHDHTGSNQLLLETANDILIQLAIRKFIYVSVHQDLMKKSIEIFDINKKRAFVISNFVSNINHNEIAFVNFKSELSILTLGNIKPQKNQLFLIQVAKELLKKDIKFHFQVVGKFQDEQYSSIFKSEIKKSNLDAFFTIHQNINNIEEICFPISFALMPSIDESGPLVNIEYLLLNIPFLSHSVGDVTMHIEKYLPNQVVHNLDAKIWANKIISFDYNFDLKEKYKKIYDNHFSEEIAYEKWLKIYN
jgi:glycosyltransferase involved in cell wall biosynthesis